MKRPILYWVILFILGEILYKVLSIYVVGILGIIYLIYISKMQRLKRKWVLHCIGIIFFFLGVFCMYSWNRMCATCDLVDGKQVIFEGCVLKREETTSSTSYIVKLQRMNGKEITTNMEVYLQEGKSITLGSEVIGVGKVKAFSKASNPGEYDEADYKRGNGILLMLENVMIEKEQRPVIPWREFLDSVQEGISDIYFNSFQEKNASLAIAMVLGDKKNLDADVKALYQRNGIAHLIAISGLHIAMIGGCFYRVLRRITGKYSFSAMIGVLFIVAYGVMTGLSGATLRAIVMLITSIGAEVAGRRYDGLTAIAIALLVMLVRNPYQITQVGFQLSFGAVIGIVLIQPIWKIWIPKLPRFLDGLFVSISVQLVLLPIMLYYFYEVPMYGIFLNVLVVPLMNLLLMMLILCAMLGFFSVQLVVLPAMLADGIFSLYELLCELTEFFPGHTICTGRPQLWWIVLYYCLLCLVIWFSYQKQKGKVGIVTMLMAMLFGSFFLPTDVLVCIYDVGQGDGIYIRTTNQKHILVDGGSSTEKGLGRYTLKSGLKFYGANQLDYVFVSHSDSDHYSGIKELLVEDLIEIENFVLPAITNPDTSYRELEALALEKGCRIYYMKKGDSLELDGILFKCLNPLHQSYEDKNAGSIVLQMKYDAFDMLLTGDLSETEERKLLQDITGTVEVLKVAHHGSATSSSDAFLQQIQPIVACVSVGEENQYGHPAKEVMERLQKFAGKIYLTKDCGAITIETDGKQYAVRTFLSK